MNLLDHLKMIRAQKQTGELAIIGKVNGWPRFAKLIVERGRIVALRHLSLPRAFSSADLLAMDISDLSFKPKQKARIPRNATTPNINDLIATLESTVVASTVTTADLEPAAVQALASVFGGQAQSEVAILSQRWADDPTQFVTACEQLAARMVGFGMARTLLASLRAQLK